MIVLHYLPTLSRQDGGTSAYMQQLAAELGQLVDLHVVVHPAEQELVLEHATVHYLELTWKWWRVREEYLDLLGTLKPDVVHVNCCWHPYFAYAVIWARSAGYRVVLTPHGMLEPWIMKRNYWTRKLPSLWLYQRKAVRQATLLHATAEMERIHLEQLGWNKNIEVIPNGISLDHVPMRNDWTRLHRLLYLGRIHPKKGIDHLIRALAALPAQYCLKIVGDGEAAYLDELKRLAVEVGVQDRVEWHDGVYGQSKWQLLQKPDVLVLPTHSENFGIVVVEALAVGTPVITTQGTPWEALQSERCGWWIPFGTDPLIKALKELIELSEDELYQMGHNGRRLVERCYTTRAVAQRFVEMYRSLLT